MSRPRHPYSPPNPDRERLRAKLTDDINETGADLTALMISAAALPDRHAAQGPIWGLQAVIDDRIIRGAIKALRTWELERAAAILIAYHPLRFAMVQLLQQAGLDPDVPGEEVN